MLLTVFCLRRDRSELTFSLQVDADFELQNFRALCELESGIPAAESQVRPCPPTASPPRASPPAPGLGSPGLGTAVAPPSPRGLSPPSPPGASAPPALRPRGLFVGGRRPVVILGEKRGLFPSKFSSSPQERAPDPRWFDVLLGFLRERLALLPRWT